MEFPVITLTPSPLLPLKTKAGAESWDSLKYLGDYTDNTNTSYPSTQPLQMVIPTQTQVNNMAKLVQPTTPVGRKLKIIGNVSGAGLPIGSVYTFAGMVGAYYRIKEQVLNLVQQDLELIPISEEELKADLDSAKAVVRRLELQIEYLKQTKATEFDDTEFRCYEAIRTMEDGNLTQLERAKILAKLVNG